MLAMTRPQAAPAVAEPAEPADVEAVMGGLDEVAQLPPAEQIEIYESVHRTLQRTLQTIEQG